MGVDSGKLLRNVTISACHIIIRFESIMFHLHLHVPLRNGGWLLVAETQKATRASLGRKMMHIYEMVPRVEGAQKEMVATSAEFLFLTIIQCCSNERKKKLVTHF